MKKIIRIALIFISIFIVLGSPLNNINAETAKNAEFLNTNLDMNKLDYVYDDYGGFLHVEIKGYDGILPLNPTFPNVEEFLQHNNIEYTNIEDWEFVVEIQANSFESKNIEGALMLPEGYLYIGEFAFNDNKITKVYGPSVYRVRNNGFSNNHIESIVLPELKDVRQEAFYNNRISGELILPSLEYISGLRAFMNNEIESIKLGPIRTIEAGAFRNNKITSVNLPNVEIVKANAFLNNEIVEVSLPNAVEIAAGAFQQNQIVKADLKNVKVFGKQSFLNNNLNQLELNDIPQEIGDKAFFKNNTTKFMGYFPLIIGNHEENFIINPHRIVVNPTDNFAEGIIGDYLYLFNLNKNDEKNGFATATDSKSDYYYCVSMFTLFHDGLFKETEVVDTVYVVQHGNSGDTSQDVDLPIQKQIVEIDKEPEDFIYGYEVDLFSKMVYHLNILLAENSMLDKPGLAPAHFINLISSNLDISNEVVLTSTNVWEHVEGTTIHGLLKEKFDDQFINELFNRVKNDTRNYTNSFYYEYVSDHELNHEDDSQPLMKPGLPIEETVSLNVTKKWIGGPTTKPSITVVLYQNGNEYKEIELSDNNDWTYIWEDLPKTDSLGVINEYTFDEKDVPENYKKRIEDNIIINEYFEEPPTPEEPPVEPPTPEEPRVEPPTPEEPPQELPPTGINSSNPFIVVILLSTVLYLLIRKKRLT